MTGLATATLLLIILPQQQDAPQGVRKLIEALRSDDVRERERATRALKKAGRAAAPELKKAAADSDKEVSSRAQYLLRVFDVQDTLTPKFMKTLPGVEDRLARTCLANR